MAVAARVADGVVVCVADGVAVRVADGVADRVADLVLVTEGVVVVVPEKLKFCSARVPRIVRLYRRRLPCTPVSRTARRQQKPGALEAF